MQQLEAYVQGYNDAAPYMPIPGNGYYNSNSFTFTLLSPIKFTGPDWTPSGWNSGWGKFVPGL
ncbi:MAG: hypothetical protein WA324_23885 [Bryobacteraceae bacterium]